MEIKIAWINPLQKWLEIKRTVFQNFQREKYSIVKSAFQNHCKWEIIDQSLKLIRVQ